MPSDSLSPWQRLNIPHQGQAEDGNVDRVLYTASGSELGSDLATSGNFKVISYHRRAASCLAGLDKSVFNS